MPYLVYVFFGFLVLGTFIIIAVVRNNSRLATTPTTPPVRTLSADEFKLQTATLLDLRKGVIPPFLSPKRFPCE